MASERVSHPRDVVNRGDELVSAHRQNRYQENGDLDLSLKSVNSTEYLDLDWEMAIQESVALQDQSTDEEPLDARAEASEPDAQAQAEE